MTGCCTDCESDIDVKSVADSLVPPSHDVKDDEKAVESACCNGSSCGCDDTCLDELARVICADDDAHLHGRNIADSLRGDADSCCGESKDATSDCTCCAKDETERDSEEPTSTIAPAPANVCEHPGLRRRSAIPSKTSPASSTKACGEHQTIARNRYNDTLAAFGCVCKALLARGLQSCCTAPETSGKAAARPKSTSSKRSLRQGYSRRSSCESASAQSYCGKSCCDEPARSSLSHRGHTRGTSTKSAKSKSLAPCIDSCCNDGCCGSGEDLGNSGNEKREHVAIDITEQNAIASNEHAVLAIKGMTCVGCENKLIRTLGGIPGIHNAKASLVLSRAEFDFDNGATDVETLVQLIEARSGFSAEIVKAVSTRKLLLTVPRPFQDKVLSMPLPPGVEAVVRSDKDTLFVDYNPTVVGARRVLKLYEPFSAVLAQEPPDPAITAGAKHIRSLFLRAILSAVLTIPVLVMTWAPLPPHPLAYSIACLVLATVVQVVITGPFYLNSYKSLVFSHLVETELLIVLSTTAAYVYSVVAFAYDLAGRPLASGQFFETSTLLVTLIIIGQVVSAIARQRAIEAISIRSLQERVVCIILSNGIEDVLDVRLLHYGDTFKVLPDSAIITDGEVVSGTSTVDESMMTGESRPVEKSFGSAVIAGTLNGPSTLLIKTTRLPGENTISDIACMVDDARFSRAHMQEAVDRICGWFVPVVLALALITFAIQLAVGVAVRHQPKGEAAVAALTYAIAVLAISCPCAIGLAVPMVILIAGGVGARSGLVFKAATTIEQARAVTHVVLDKTGTVTQGKLSVVSRFMDDAAAFNVSASVAQLVATSRHPVARAVAADLNLTATADAQVTVEGVEEVTGRGIQGTLLGQPIRGGSAQWLALETHPSVQGLLAQGLTTFCVMHGNRLLATFGLSDTLRPEALSVIQSLAKRKINVSILSGDHPAAVFATATSLNIPVERVRAGCLPADKQAYIKTLTAQGETVLFCGDGTNDAVALAQAAVGVHLHTGDGASIAASTAADVVLTHPSLTGLLTLLELSDAVSRRIALNFAWSGVYNLVAILLAAGAFVHARIPPAYAGLGEIVSVVPVVLVALQLMWFKTSVV